MLSDEIAYPITLTSTFIQEIGITGIIVAAGVITLFLYVGHIIRHKVPLSLTDDTNLDISNDATPSSFE